LGPFCNYFCEAFTGFDFLPFLFLGCNGQETFLRETVMKKLFLFSTAAVLGFSTLAFAGGKLHNKDSESYDIRVQCNGGSTAVRSISGSTVADVGSGTCTVTLTKSGASTTVADGDTVYIQNGGFSK
jgi:hypothetical protein